MLKEAVYSAPTVEQATQGALAELAAPEDADVKIEVLEFPVKKTFGLFGGSPAKVRACYETAAEATPAKPPVQEAAKPVSSKKPTPRPTAPQQKATDTVQNTQSPIQTKTQDLPCCPASTPVQQATQAYLQTMLNALKLDHVQILFHEADGCLFIQVNCGSADYGAAIGRRGETLDALQYLTRLFLNRSGASYERVTLNVGDYRKKRENTLRALAQRNADRARKYGRNVVMDPMNPFERRIIHTTIQEMEGVSSHSVGSDDARKVVITPDGIDPRGISRSKPSGGYNNRGRDSRDFRDSRDRRGPRPPRQEASASRPPRSDDSSIPSKYGKIEINKETKPE